MSYNEMITIVLALVLFTSIAMVANSNLLTQAEHLHDAFYELQAMQIAQHYLDRIDERLFSDVIRFSSISANYEGQQTFYSPKDNLNYLIQISGTFSDSLGNELSTESHYYRIDLEVSTQEEHFKPIRISRLYADI